MYSADSVIASGNGAPTEAAAKTPQLTIEKKMTEILGFGAYEAAYLFSDEGLPIAQASTTNGLQVDRDRIAELSILFHDVRRLAAVMGGISRLREVMIEGEN